jgi:hypothetical protein
MFQDASGFSFDCRHGARHRGDAAALENPGQPGGVMAREAVVGQVRIFRRHVEPEEVAAAPAKRRGLFPPQPDEQPGVVNAPPPSVLRDEVRTAAFQRIEFR